MVQWVAPNRTPRGAEQWRFVQVTTLAAVPDTKPKQLKLPTFEGHAIATARIALGGALDLALTSVQDVEMVNALTLGTELTVSVEIPGTDEPIVLSARVTRRGHRLRKIDESEQPVSDYRITVNSVADAED